MKIDGFGTTVQSATAKTEDKQALNKDTFLKLFVTQMQNQDPLKPMDGSDLAVQMAQFSSLEQLYNMNSSMDNLISYATSQNNLQLASLIGKQVEAQGQDLSLQDGKVSQAWYEMSGDAASRVVSIYDDQGALVRSLNFGSGSAGRYAIEWDGKGRTGEAMPDGRYSFEVMATNGRGGKVPVDQTITGSVTGLNFDQGTTNLYVDGLKVSVSDIVEVVNPNSQP